MKIYVRAHDLQVKGADEIVKELLRVGADGVQMVCYKSFKEIEKAPGRITIEKAKEIGDAFKREHFSIRLIGAYFNPVHSDENKVKDGIEIFKDYIRVSSMLGCDIVGSETGSYNDEPWIYHPKNRTHRALEKVAEIFKRLCDYALEYKGAVGIEGASGHVCYDVEALDEVTKLIGRKNLRIIFDLYNFMDNENCKDYMKILLEGLNTFTGRIHCFHIKDCIFTDEGIKQCAVGKGDLDFDSIIPMIKKYDKNAALILEGTKKDEIKNSIEFLQEKWNKA